MRNKRQRVQAGSKGHYVAESPVLNHDWSGLREIARALSGAHDLGTTLDLIAAKTAEVMAVDSCSIYLLDGDTLWLRASTGLSRQAVGRGSLKLGEGLTGWSAEHNEPVAEHNEPVAETEAQSDPRFKFVPYTGERAFHSLLAVPLVSEGRVTGAMNVQTYAPHAFTEAEITLLSLIADLAAGVLKRASLSDNLNRQLAELKTLARVSQTVNQPLYLDDMLNVVVEMAAKVMGAAVCTLRLVDEAQEGLVVRAAASRSWSALQPPTSRAMRRNRRCGSMKESMARSSARENRSPSAMCAPIRVSHIAKPHSVKASSACWPCP